MLELIVILPHKTIGVRNSLPFSPRVEARCFTMLYVLMSSATKVYSVDLGGRTSRFLFSILSLSSFALVFCLDVLLPIEIFLPQFLLFLLLLTFCFCCC